MSDDPNITAANHFWGPHMGVTLPNSSNATFNITLSPLFLGRFGLKHFTAKEVRVEFRGESNYSHSSTSMAATYNYFLGVDAADSRPLESGWRYYGNSLRCLVSTTNS